VWRGLHLPQRLRSQLALVIAIAMAPAGILALLQAYASADDAIGQREAVFASEMRATALKERDTLLRVRTALAAAADSAEEQFLETGDCGRALGALAAQTPNLGRAALLNAAGETVCGTEAWTVSTDLPQWSEFLRWPHAMFSLDPSADADAEADGIWPVVALHPTVFNREEAFALAAEMDLLNLRTLAAGGGAGRIYGVSDSRGTLITDAGNSDGRWLPGDVTALLGAFERSVTATSEGGAQRLYITQPLIDGQLWAVASTPKATVTDILLSRDGVTVLAPVLLWLLAVAVAYVSIDKLVTRHIADLHRATARIGRGDPDVEIRSAESAPAEIRALGQAILDMTHNLQTRDAHLRDLIERQKNLILEIHHRVKNNLQMVTSLINIQLRRARTADERAALRFLEDRIQSLALVHHHLYGTEELDRIPLDELVRDICERLKMSMTPIGAGVDFRYELTPLIVDSRIATPVALFLTEAVSNAFKHAVPQTGQHEIGILLQTSARQFTLEVRNRLTGAAETGAEGGAEAEADAGRQRLGMRLLRSFAAQLDGSFEKIVDADDFRLVLTAPAEPRGSAPAPGCGG
jgi:two-component sensor histidine kinase